MRSVSLTTLLNGSLVPTARGEHATKRLSARSQHPTPLSGPDGARESLCSRILFVEAQTGSDCLDELIASLDIDHASRNPSMAFSPG